MKELKITNLKIKEFCGVYAFESKIDTALQNFNAVNGNGKSSLRKAVLWALGINVGEIMPTKNKIEIQNLVPTVEVELFIDGLYYTIKKVWKTSYVENEETKQLVKKSAKSIYFIDNMEITEKNFKEKILQLLELNSYEQLELLLNIETFNQDTTKWKWTNRRKLLLEMSNSENVDQRLIEENLQYAPLKDYILKGYASSDISSAFKKEKKGYNEQITRNNINIEQKNIEIAKLLEIDFKAIEDTLKAKELEYDKLVDKDKKATLTSEIKALTNELYILQQELSKEQIKQSKELQQLNTQKTTLYNEITNLSSTIKQLQVEIDNLENEKTFAQKPIKEICPTCKQRLPEEEIENTKKSMQEKITAIEKDIEKTFAKIENHKPTYISLKEQYDGICEQIKTFADSDIIIKLKQDIQDKENEIKNSKQKDLINNSNEKISALKEEISNLIVMKSKQEDLEKMKNMVKTWKQENCSLADSVLDTDRKIKLLNDFVKEQCAIIENDVNSLFGNEITFALFDIVDNNGDPKINEACETIFKGRNYKACSTGEKAICDLRITEKLQDFYNVNLPLFVDNTESITNKIESDRQLIRLRAMENSKIDGLVKIEEMF